MPNHLQLHLHVRSKEPDPWFDYQNTPRMLPIQGRGTLINAQQNLMFLQFFFTSSTWQNFLI